jgi:outer membrane protein assembly factor BamB
MRRTIFCPTCGELILDEPGCAGCGWQRPVAVDRAGQAAWCADTGTRLIRPACQPALAAGLYLLGTETGTLLALHVESGTLAWERSAPASCMAHGLASDGERLFVGCEDVRPIPSSGKPLLALDVRTGEELWSCPTQAHSLSAAAVAGGVVYFASSDGLLHALDAASGAARWSVKHPAWSPAAPAVAEGIVCAGGRREELVAYDAETGAERWRVAGGGWFASQPCLSGGTAYATAWDGWLYAVDLQSGRLRWKVTGEREGGFTSPPLAAGERVLAGSRVSREMEGRREKTYALLALDAADGRELWRAYAGKHVQPAPAVAGGLVFFGADDGVLYAVEEASGEEVWRMETGSRVVAQPQVTGDWVIFGGRDGLVRSVRWRAPAKEEMPSAEELAAAGRCAEAAVAFALRGDLARAASVYGDKLGLHREAALLYERAEQAGPAAAEWAAHGDLRRARELYVQAGDDLGLAGVLVQANEPLQAARLYEKEGALERAAELYDRAGDRPRAADLYRKAGRPDLARPIYRSLGAWEQEVETLLREAKPDEAARILDEHGRLERAAELYEEAHLDRDALRLRLQLEHWDKAAELASTLGEHEERARILERMGEQMGAAEAYERAAEQAAHAQPADPARAAALYEQAAAIFSGLFETGREAACRWEVKRHRHLPDIAVEGEARSVFEEYTWNDLVLRVRNAGFGRAGRISVELRGRFDVGGRTTIDSLGPGEPAASLVLRARPQKEEWGPAVPLEIVVAYEDIAGHGYEVSMSMSVHVEKAGGLAGLLDGRTPLSINIHGDVVRDKFGGHQVQSGGQAGDRVEINKGERGARPAPQGGPVGDRVEVNRGGVVMSCEGERVQVRGEGAPVRRCPRCNLPIEDLGHRYCPDCGTALEERPA